MDGQTSRHSATSSSWLYRDGPWLAVLLLIVATLRLWLLVNTEVTARDSIGFIRYSLLFDRMTWTEAVRSQHQHPGYPSLVWLAAKPIRAVWGTTPDSMRIAAQIISLLASLGLAVMMFRLGKVLWDRYVGFFAALLFQCLPISGHHLSDGISDGLFLFLVAAALDCIVRARDAGSLTRYAVGGICIGLAYFTRPEGMLVMPAAWLFLLALQFTRQYAQSWRQVASGLTALSLGCVIAASPYVLTTGRITQKLSAIRIIEQAELAPLLAPILAPMPGGDGPLFASLFGANFAPAESNREQLYLTVRSLVLELSQAFNYVGVVLVIWALLFTRRDLTRNVGFYLLAIYFAIHAVILVCLGLKVSYVSDRHVMALVMLGCYPCVVAMLQLNRPWIAWTKADSTPVDGFLQPRVVVMASTFWLIAALGACGAKTVTRLHSNRIGNHEAGLWLAENSQPTDFIEDDHSWSHYYAGQMFLEGREPAVPKSVTPNHFVVLTRSRDELVSEKRNQIEASLRNENARIVYHWPTTVPEEKARIVIYAKPRNFAIRPWPIEESATAIHPVSRPK